MSRSWDHRQGTGSRNTPGETGIRAFVFFLVAFIVFVLALQVLLRSDPARRLMNESIRLEGEPLARTIDGLRYPMYPWLDSFPADRATPTGVLYLRVLREPIGETWILVNGRPVRSLNGDGAAVTVADGDVIEIVSRGVSLVVSQVTKNLASPAVGDWVQGGGVLLLCRARTR